MAGYIYEGGLYVNELAITFEKSLTQGTSPQILYTLISTSGLEMQRKRMNLNVLMLLKTIFQKPEMFENIC